MASNYYKSCKELDRCLEIDKLWEKDKKKWFKGYLVIAEETSYALAECQVGYAYFEGVGTDKDMEKALYWTTRSAEHGDRDGQYNLAWIYEKGLCGEIDLEKAKYWYKKSALQDHDLSIEKCKELFHYSQNDEK